MQTSHRRGHRVLMSSQRALTFMISLMFLGRQRAHGLAIYRSIGPPACRTLSSVLSVSDEPVIDPRVRFLKRGDEIDARILSFGTIGASVEVILKGEQALAVARAAKDGTLGFARGSALSGMVPQIEISLFREARGEGDVMIGDTIPAYVHHIRDDGRVDVGLRPDARGRVQTAQEQLLLALEARCLTHTL